MPIIKPNPSKFYAYTQEQIADPNISAPAYAGNGLDVYNAIVNPPLVDFRKNLTNRSVTVLSDSPPYSAKNIEGRLFLGDPGNKSGKDLTSYTNGVVKGAASVNSYDKINAIPLYSATNPEFTNPTNDLAKFAIGVIDNGTPSNSVFIHFRAFLNQITDQYSSDWQDARYIGRGEKFYTYTGFDRKVSLSWTTAAQSKAELMPMYRKLNYLASVCAPDYSGKGYMRGNIITLTIGGYFFQQPGIVTGFSYEMNEDNATWEIGLTENGGLDGSVKELPHLIKVSGFNFIPIHRFVPKLQQNGYGGIDPTNVLKDNNTYGQERYIALEAGNNNYDVK